MAAITRRKRSVSKRWRPIFREGFGAVGVCGPSERIVTHVIQTHLIIGGGLSAWRRRTTDPALPVRSPHRPGERGCRRPASERPQQRCAPLRTATKPGSVKARLAVSGIQEMVEFCREHKIPRRLRQTGGRRGRTGTGAVARLHERGQQNGLQGLKLLSRDEMREIEPHAAVSRRCACLRRIVDYPGVCAAIATQMEARVAEYHPCKSDGNPGANQRMVGRSAAVISRRISW